jgi:hypothetical protein
LVGCPTGGIEILEKDVSKRLRSAAPDHSAENINATHIVAFGGGSKPFSEERP